MKRQARVPRFAALLRGCDLCHCCLFVTGALLLFLCGLVSPASAEEPARPSLVGKIDLRFQRCRSGAPIPVQWEIEWNEQTIATGNLEYQIDDGNELVGSFRMSDVTLSPGKNAFNSMLPAMTVFGRSAPVTLRVRFLSGKRTYEFEEQSLRVPNRFTQWFNVAIVSGAAGKTTPTELKRLDAIRWERLLPDTDPKDRSSTVSLEIQTTQLPAEPLTFCNFDTVVLMPTALSEIRDDQAEALKKWVTAGGSVCLIAGGGLNARHARWMNDLLSESASPETLLVDSHGYLAPGEDFKGEIATARKGLGRVVLLRQTLFANLDPDAKDWVAAAEFLMKARKDVHARNLTSRAQSAPWTTAPSRPSVGASRANRPTTQKRSPAKTRQAPGGMAPNQAAARPNFVPPTIVLPGAPVGVARRTGFNTWRMPYDPRYLMQADLSPPPLVSLSGLFQLLMPRDVQMVPLSLIAAVLAAYVVVIGPVDYFVLGLLRMRRLTWILFPVVTIGFAVFTLWLSRWYLGTNDSRQAIEINDVVKGGTIARRTRVELLFLSRAREVGTEVQNGAFAQLGLGVTNDPRLMMSVARPSNDVPRGPNVFAGRMPSRYVVGQSVPQWTPIVNRFFWIDPKPARSEKPEADPVAQFNWDDLGDLSTNAGRQALGARIRQAFGESACAVIFQGGNQQPVPILHMLQSLRPPKPDGIEYVDDAGIGQIVGELSCRPPAKLFALTSQVAPNGSSDLDDLAILDGSDPKQSLLVIGVPSGPDLVFYRRLYAGGP